MFVELNKLVVIAAVVIVFSHIILRTEIQMSSMDDIIKLIARRDNISFIEAQNLVYECLDEMESALRTGNWQETEDILASYLSLEPDYLSILLEEMF